MGFLRDLVSKTSGTGRRPVSEAQDMAVRADAVEDGDDLVELNIVGESHRQSALAAIAGPKDGEGKAHRVGATLRCEPSNPYDRNAVRVEVMGQLLAYCAREQAAELSPAVQRVFKGSLEARGLIVGGWDDGKTEGSYGIRVWITNAEVQRLGIAPGVFNPRLVEFAPQIPWPIFANPLAGETRLTPPPWDEYPAANVTVTCEEHYQEVLVPSKPEPWERGYWPVLVTLDIAAANPHSKHPAPCIRVALDGHTVGYLTAAMTTRHRPAVDAALGRGHRVTAIALVNTGHKGDANFLRVKVAIPT